MIGVVFLIVGLGALSVGLIIYCNMLKEKNHRIKNTLEDYKYWYKEVMKIVYDSKGTSKQKIDVLSSEKYRIF